MFPSRWKGPVRPKWGGDRCVAGHIQNGMDVGGSGRDVFVDEKEEDNEMTT